MLYNLFVQSEALNDIRDAFEWYEEKQSGLGFELIEELEVCYGKVCNHPQYYLSINNSFRRIKVNRFPYLIIYEIEENLVIIVAVKHDKKQ